MRRWTPTSRAFTLIELLVVISIISIVMALSFPMIGAMRRDINVSSGINTVAVAAASIRRYASDPEQAGKFEVDLEPDDTAKPETLGDQNGAYSGAAIIFTPAGEIRLTRNEPQASSREFLPFDTSRFLERHGPNIDDIQPTGTNSTPKRELNGFRDLEIDYLLLPSDTAVVGINRVSGGGIVDGGPGIAANPTDPPLLLAPPFAIWFDQSGYMTITGWNTTRNRAYDHQFVYYDGNYDGNFEVTKARANVNNYNPYEYNPNHRDFEKDNWNIDREKYELPFEKLEAVIGVYVYSREAFENAAEDGLVIPWLDSGGSANDSRLDNNDRWEWMRNNGQMLLFSRQTGTLMRNRDE